MAARADAKTRSGIAFYGRFGNDNLHCIPACFVFNVFPDVDSIIERDSDKTKNLLTGFYGVFT